MGRQIQIAMDSRDEQLLLAFLRETADIQLFESFAPTPRELRVDNFARARHGHWTYLAWNRGFAWRPRYGRVGPRAYYPSTIGWAYVSNANAAPVLEITRSNLRDWQFGRLYWARDFAAPDGLRYDAEAFSRWIEEIWRWCRRIGRKDSKWAQRDPYFRNPYFLPGAWAAWRRRRGA